MDGVSFFGMDGVCTIIPPFSLSSTEGFASALACLGHLRSSHQNRGPLTAAASQGEANADGELVLKGEHDGPAPSNCTSTTKATTPGAWGKLSNRSSRASIVAAFLAEWGGIRAKKDDTFIRLMPRALQQKLVPCCRPLLRHGCRLVP